MIIFADMKRIVLLIALLCVSASSASARCGLCSSENNTPGFVASSVIVRDFTLDLEYSASPWMSGWNFEKALRVDRERRGGLDYFTVRFPDRECSFRSVVGDNGTFEGVPVDSRLMIGISPDLNSITVTNELGQIFYFGDNPGEKEYGPYRESDSQDIWASSWLLRRIELPGSTRYLDFKWEKTADGKSHLKEIVTPFEKVVIRYKDGLPDYFKVIHEDQFTNKGTACFYTDGVLSSARVSAKGEYKLSYDSTSGYLSRLDAPDGCFKLFEYAEDKGKLKCTVRRFCKDGKEKEKVESTLGNGMRLESREKTEYQGEESTVTCETFYYRDGLLRSISSSSSDGHSKSCGFRYPAESIESASPEQKVALNAMLGLNMEGLVVSRTVNEDGKTSVYRYDYGRYSDISLYLPSKLYVTSTGEKSERLSKEFNWDKYGEPVSNY